MDHLTDVNWSEVLRKSLDEYISQREKGQRFDPNDISMELKSISGHYSYNGAFIGGFYNETNIILQFTILGSSVVQVELDRAMVDLVIGVNRSYPNDNTTKFEVVGGGGTPLRPEWYLESFVIQKGVSRDISYSYDLPIDVADKVSSIAGKELDVQIFVSIKAFFKGPSGPFWRFQRFEKRIPNSDWRRDFKDSWEEVPRPLKSAA